jgi:hypothetical protein
MRSSKSLLLLLVCAVMAACGPGTIIVSFNYELNGQLTLLCEYAPSYGVRALVDASSGVAEVEPERYPCDELNGDITVRPGTWTVVLSVEYEERVLASTESAATAVKQWETVTIPLTVVLPPPQPEDCGNVYDDDLDASADCWDDDCAPDPACL